MRTSSMGVCSAVLAALLLACTQVAFAEDMDKGKFKQGCESGGNSYVDNNDGSFQCNLKSGATIKCPDTKSQCSYTAQLSSNLVFKGLRAGQLKMLAAPMTKATPKKTTKTAKTAPASQ